MARVQTSARAGQPVKKIILNNFYAHDELERNRVKTETVTADEKNKRDSDKEGGQETKSQILEY